MLLDPPEEEFHLPARLVDLGDRKCRQHEVVSEKLQALVGFGIVETHAPQGVRIYFGGLDGGQNHRLIGSNAGFFVHRTRVAPLEQDVLFCAYDEEGRTQGEDVQTFEVDVAAVHDVERAGFGENLVEDIHVVHFAVSNAYKRGDIAVQVQQRVHLHRGFMLAKFRPREQGETQVDGGRVERVEGVVQFQPDRVFAM